MVTFSRQACYDPNSIIRSHHDTTFTTRMSYPVNRMRTARLIILLGTTHSRYHQNKPHVSGHAPVASGARHHARDACISLSDTHFWVVSFCGDMCCFLTKVVLFFNIRIPMHINAF